GINIYYTWTDDRNGSFDVYAKISEYGSPAMVITPMSFQFTAEFGGSNPATQNLLISNLGYGILNWRATSNQSWLQVTPATGTAPSTAIVSVNTTGLAYGSYNGRITIADVSGKDSSRTAVVALDITAPVMQIVPQTISIEAHLGAPPPDDKFVQINNTGSGTLNWTLSGMPSWLKFSMTSGTAPSATDIIILTDSLPAQGQYTANVAVTSTQAVNSPQNLTVQLSYLADVPIIATDPDTVHLTFAVNATTITSQELVIYNIGVGTLNWTISADATWVSLSSETGVGDAVVNVGAQPSMLAVGDHYSQLTITDPNAYNSPHCAVAHAHVTDTPPIIQVAPDSLSFLCYDTGPQDSARTVSIANGGGGDMSWSVTENAVWLSFNPSSGSGADQTLATVSTGGLPNGNYTAWAYFNAPGSTNLKDSIFVRLQIVAWLPKICGLPPSLQFLAREDLASADTQTVTVNTCAAPGMNWSIATSPAWLSASPAAGTESQSSDIIMNTAGMVAGTYGGQIVVSAPEASNSPVTVPVTLQVLPRDTIALSSTRVVAGQPFTLDLCLHNLLPVDSAYLQVQFDNSYFEFDSISAASRLAGLMTFQVVSQQALALTQTTIATVKVSSQIPRGDGNIAILNMHAVASAGDGTHPVSCSTQLRDSLGLLMTLPVAIGQVTIMGQTPVEPEPVGELPHEFHLYQNFPNPFNSSTIIYYSLAQGTDVRLEVLNIIGQSVRTLFSGYQSIGGYSIAWDGLDDYAQGVGSGIYFVRLATDTRADYVKAVLLK
ncbi:MAG: T9SS type A sorting domain-containing protein, partial [candidate division Zixibacteria bacterium]|nr:T9SS type A sorting domain-containing protein [candidate division Zixibacteria bacterium]